MLGYVQAGFFCMAGHIYQHDAYNGATKLFPTRIKMSESLLQNHLTVLLMIN